MGKVAVPVSPGGALMRTSRLFSLPKPLPTGSVQRVPSSTPPFPTYQVITTTPVSRKQGDWGLKRPLPTRNTTKTTAAMLKVHEVDTVEHVTDYGVATDIGISLLKWQEMNIPIMIPEVEPGRSMTAVGSNAKASSVFEDRDDFTVRDKEKANNPDAKRWKFRGPWLAGMSQGQFKRWLAKDVRTRRHDFLDFLKTKLAAQRAAKKIDAAEEGDVDALDMGGIQEMHETHEKNQATTGQVEEASLRPIEFTEEELTEFIRTLRNDLPRLYEHVGQFLDLAPLQPPKTSVKELATKEPHTQSFVTSKNPYAEFGPPRTHPSAGLSYLRSSAYIENHPLYGPQNAHSPVEARVLTPVSHSTNKVPMLGVGGFISRSPLNRLYGQSNHIPGFHFFDPQLKGGSKLWVTPKWGMINSRGQVILLVSETGGNGGVAQKIAEELIGVDRLFGKSSEQDQADEKNFDRYKNKSVRVTGKFVSSSAETYGWLKNL